MGLRIQDPLLFDAALPTLLGSLPASLSLTPQEIDLIFDLQYFEPGRERMLALLLQGVANTIPTPMLWRTFSLASSAFPKDFSGLPDFNVLSYTRSEWSLWTMIRSGVVSFPRTPTFADYAINHAEFEDMDPRTMMPNGNIRYTIDAQWLYFKGTILRDMKRMGVVIRRSPGYAQFVDLAKMVIAHVSYSGPTFSPGDQQIDDVANSRASTGNLETWRKIGTNHHVTFVVRQIASSSWPSGSTAPIP